MPWELHPKTVLDLILDILSQLPGLLHHADELLSLPPSVANVPRIQDLLATCVMLEHDFKSWYAQVEEMAGLTRENPLLYWVGTHTGGVLGQYSGAAAQQQAKTGQSPFEEVYEFPSPIAGFSHVVYWTGLVVLYRLIQTLVAANSTADMSNIMLPTLFEEAAWASAPVGMRLPGVMGTPAEDIHVSHYGQTDWPVSNTEPSGEILSTSSTSLNPAKYETREILKLAANVCRSLDWIMGGSGGNDGLGALGQPDIVAGPLQIVEQFYQDLEVTGDGQSEMIWCKRFRDRFEQRGQEVERIALGMDEMKGKAADPRVGSREWTYIGKFEG
ncbi:hypothetical protein BX600DRAFT_471294 [Xylariales sp. PMI_506]|nr:hypothetical protein BX600DRAFT_471294 [Xylariales sp. PMI_506]